jgi:hypothetical protein
MYATLPPRQICCGPFTNLTKNFFISLYFLKSARGLAADAWNGQCVGQNIEVEAEGALGFAFHAAPPQAVQQ